MYTQRRTKEPIDDASQALNAALRALTSREHSYRELQQKLLRRYTKEAVKEALDKCVEEGWQSDERYADMLLRHMQFSGFGPLKFKFEAVKKGLSSELIAAFIEQGDWRQIACDYLLRRFGDDETISELTRERRQKILALMARRGFSGSDCLYALNFLCLNAPLHV